MDGLGIYNSIWKRSFRGPLSTKQSGTVELRHFPHLCRLHFATEIQLELIMHGSPASEHVVHTFRVKPTHQTKVAGIHNTTWICLRWLERMTKNIPQMAVFHGDEYHARIRKNYRLKKSKKISTCC